ncbi:MAG: SMP-30/gluconolactonase/LRE family protein [Planctomycetaceae bacterium]|nr:SMP-30/gluconolactonase/LRE family protein [Planctomycetaceae bacterium]
MSASVMEVLWQPDSDSLGYLPEGPVECSRGRISWVAIQHGPEDSNGSLNLLDPATGTNRSLALPGRPGFAFPTTEPDVFLVGLERRVQRVRFSDGHCRAESDEVDVGVENTIINDGIAIDEGLVFGCKDLDFAEHKAGLYFWRSRDRRLFRLRDDQLCSNGKVARRDSDGWLIWDIDSPTKTVVKYRLDPVAGTLSEPEIVLDLTGLPFFPDGMVAGRQEASVIIAFYNPEAVEAGEVHEYDLVSGDRLATWLVPGSPQVTCPLLWQSPTGSRLVVTTAAENMSVEKRSQYPRAGAMFVSDPLQG